MIDLTDMVIISDPGGTHATRVPVTGVQAAWALSNVGSFSAFTPLAVLRAYGWGGDLKDCWLEWSDPIAGRWGGVITGRPVSDGIAELAAEDWAGLLRGQVLDVWQRPPWGSPAGLARLAVAHALREQPSFITVGEVQEAGAAPVSVTFGGQDLLSDVLPALADLGLEWRVDADRVLHLGRRLGRDLSATAVLFDDREIVGYSLADDILALTSSQRVQIESAQQALLREQAVPRRRRGWRDPRILHPRNRPEGVPLVPDITGQTPLTVPFSAQVRDVGGVWASCDLGNTVRVVLASAGFDGLFRVVERGLDTVGRVMSVAGEITPDPSWQVF